MSTKDVIYELRTKMGLSQDELAEKVFVTRQAVSRWETGETVPNTETLKLLSKLFDVSINTLLGSPRQLRCQCCGMPLEDSIISREKDGTLNEDYCQWCYADGTYTYSDMDDLIETCLPHMVNENFTEEQARAYMKQMLPELDYWKRYEELSDDGQFVNLPYRLPSGAEVKFLDDKTTYLGNQLESEFGGDRCFGVLANMDFIMVVTYEKDGVNPELVLYKKR